MAILWAESFDYYGNSPNGGRDAMLQGAWAQFQIGSGNALDLSSAQARTGTYSMRIAYSNAAATSNVYCRRVIGAAQTVVGLAQGLWFSALPGANKEQGFEFRNNANQAIVMVTINSDGAIGLYAGTGHTLVAVSDPVFTANSWQHVECKLVTDTVVGEFECRVNGVTVMHVTDQNFGSLGATQIVWGTPIAEQSGSTSITWYIDDIVVWNNDGSETTDFVGQCRVETIFPASDTAQADWTKVGDSDGFDCIDNVPPDGDTTYIQAADIGDISEFGLASLPPETAKIVAVYVPTLGKIDGAGVGAIKTGMKSGSDLVQSGEITLTTAYTYWGAVFETDPATDEPWTKAGLEAALLHYEKTA